MKGSVKCNLTGVRAPDKRFTRYVPFKRPLSLKWLEADQNGRQSHNYKMFLVVRSNVPHQGPGQAIDYQGFAPHVQCFTKVSYHE